MSDRAALNGILLADFPKLPLPEERTNELVAEAHDWAHAHGLVLRTRDNASSSEICQTAPIALLPSPFPRKLFEQACKAQNLMAGLYHQLAYDMEFLIKCHEEVVKTDPFTKGLIDILKAVKEEGLAQPITLAIQRSDYMCHNDKFSCEYYLKQIEINNIASSMGAHAERVSMLHRRTLSCLGYEKELIEKACPSNEPIDMIATSLFKAWSHFADPAAVVLVIVEDVNQNQIDQRHVEYSLEEKGVPVDQIVRKTLTQCKQCLSLSPDRQLLLSGSRVGVVYFRAGYSPDHYPTENEWAARLLIERSDAIKTPWIGLQVANTKKTQQVLAEDGVVERYVGNPREAAAIRDTFAGLWSIEGQDPVTQRMIAGAISHPTQFVLKPQLEGGGGNFYGEEMVSKLQTMSREEMAAHILMERIQPLVVQNYLVRSLQPTVLSDVVSELGIYGYALGDQKKVDTVTGGHLLRTKGEKTDEGGVAVGAAVIDSPFLFELL